MSRLVRRLSTSSRGSYNLTHGSRHLENWCHQQCFFLESTNFIMNTYVNVAFLRLLLSAEQLAKSDQHLEEELMFCAQANPLSQ